MLGIGHGGIEAMVFGGVQVAASVTSLLSLQSVDLTTLNLSADQMTALSHQLETLNGSPLWAALPFMERCFAMVIHVLLSLLVWRAFAQRKAWYVPLAIAYHAAFDAVAVYVAQQTESVVIIYGTLLLLLVPGLVWLWRVWRKEAGPRHVAASPGSRVALFSSLLRAKSCCSNGAPNGSSWWARCSPSLACLSPLAAKFTPEIFRVGSRRGAVRRSDPRTKHCRCDDAVRQKPSRSSAL